MDLTADNRKKMPSKDFAGKGKSFPVNDKTHARLAISGATRSEASWQIFPPNRKRRRSKPKPGES